jgi:hypothetical protein
MKIGKLDAAKRQLVTAVNLFLRNCDPISVHSLAQASREILATLCQINEKDDLATFIADHNSITRRDVFALANKHRNFFKHADRDPDVLIQDFSDLDNDAIIYTAVHDLKLLTTQIPVECQLFEPWFFATHPEVKRLEVSDQFAEQVKELFPNLSEFSRDNQKKFGLRVLGEALISEDVMRHPATDQSTLSCWPTKLLLYGDKQR